MRFRIRVKGKQIVCEGLEGKKVIESWTLNEKNAEKIAEMLRCLKESTREVSKSTKETQEKEPQKFGQSLLREPLNEPENQTLSLKEINEHNETQEYIRELEDTLDKQRKALKELGL